ncbi:MAG: glycosyltransferase family 2 protein [Alphaproteobacteria bacterium]|nr:glycosyltransferase family 2 protein [Alphaproteobacteria bacterium]
MKKKLTIFTLIFLIILSVWYYYQQKITLSVIVPVYNAEKYIQRCLDSIIKQKGDFEIIVVDDGSTDKTPLILKEYAKNNSNIKIITQSNKGVSSARNTGIKASNSKYITFVDSDDWLEPNAFAKASKIIKQDKSDVILTGYYDVYDREWIRNIKGEKYVNEAPEISKYPTRTLDKLSLFSPFYANDSYSDLYYSGTDIRGKFYLKKFLSTNNILFAEDINCAEDIIFNFEIFLKNPKISILDAPIYNYYNRVDSISKSINMVKWAPQSIAKMQQKEAYKKANRNIQLLIDDSLLFLVNIGISNTIRQSGSLNDIKDYVLNAYSSFDKYNIAEKKSLRNYLKLHNMLLNN